jgi:hypothetical protein
MSSTPSPVRDLSGAPAAEPRSSTLAMPLCIVCTMGRPSKLTPELQSYLLKMLRAGVHPETACKVEGIALSTFYEWRKRGEDGEDPYAEFLFESTRASALVIGRLEHEIVKAAAHDWRAGAYVLSKRMRAVYGDDKHRLEISGVDGGPLPVRHLSDEVAEEIRRKILYGDTEPLPPGERDRIRKEP